MPVHGVIFDVDGTLVDSNAAHAQAWQQALAHHGLEVATGYPGRGCVALMLSVVYHGRALPLAWIVVEGRKGHFPQAQHCALLAQIQPLIPATAQVTVLGDDEFDGTDFQALIATYGWQYVCRTGRNSVITTAEGIRVQVGDLVPERGESRMISPAWMTEDRYGPITLLTITQRVPGGGLRCAAVSGHEYGRCGGSGGPVSPASAH